MYINSYLQAATQLLKEYTGYPPFHQYIKNFFKQYKKYGSKDRKHIIALCYSYYRIGQAMLNNFSTERFAAGLLLSSTTTNPLLNAIQPLWNKLVEKNFSIEKKIQFLEIELSFNSNQIFPFTSHLSSLQNITCFQQSHLIQPKVYLRVRPNKKETILKKLEHLNWSYHYIEPNTISLPIGYNIEEHFNIDEEIIIQDLSSQKIGIFLEKINLSTSQPIQQIWDACAGSGGKSILAYDILPNIQLTVSDIRKSILHNLQQRFKKAGITKYNSLVLDVSNVLAIPSNFKKAFDLIIADVPCTGSGTWGRTPEQLLFFDEKEIEKYINRQQKILQNIIPALKPGGCLLYCTCSVFKAENEDQVNWLKQKGLECIEMQLLESYIQQADSLFVALFKKTLI